MKIAFIVDTFPKLSETFILNQITGLIDLGHEVEIFAGVQPSENKMHSEIKEYRLLEHTHYHNEIPPNRFYRIMKAIFLAAINILNHPYVILHSLNVFNYIGDAWSLKLFYKAVLFLTKGKFDIIQCHFGPNGNLGALLKEIGIQGKLVTMFHGYDIRLGIKEEGNIYDKLFRYGDCFLSISDYTSKHLLTFGANQKKIVYHPVGINLDKFPFRWNTAFIELPTPTRIMTIGRLTKEKGFFYAILAIEKLIKQNPDLRIEYQIIGDGPLKDKLKKMVEDLKLEKIVHFLGPQKREEVINALKQAHLFFLPSNAEVLPVVLMEALAVGLPVVATLVGAISELGIDGKSGFLVPRGDVDAMAERLEYLIRNPEIWPDMGRAGRQFVEKNYNINTLNNKLVDIYQKLLYGRLP